MLDCPSLVEGEKITGAAPEDTPVMDSPPSAKVGKGVGRKGGWESDCSSESPEREATGAMLSYHLQGEDEFTMKKLCVVKNIR